jgi:hypothetical protein
MSESHETMNEWFLSLPEGRQRVLHESKWMLAEAAYNAGKLSLSASERQVLDRFFKVTLHQLSTTSFEGQELTQGLQKLRKVLSR